MALGFQLQRCNRKRDRVSRDEQSAYRRCVRVGGRSLLIFIHAGSSRAIQLMCSRYRFDGHDVVAAVDQSATFGVQFHLEHNNRAVEIY